jgi:hypothetical protein
LYHFTTFSLAIFNEIFPSSQTTFQFFIKSLSEHSAIGFVIFCFLTNLKAISPSFSTILCFDFSSSEHSATGFNSFHFSSIFIYIISFCSIIPFFDFSSSEHSESIFIVSCSSITSTKIEFHFSIIL